MSNSAWTRRQFLGDIATGLGGIAVASLLGDDRSLASSVPNPEFNGGLHHRARVKRVIQLFMNGGASQCDLFDYKPKLVELHGRSFDPGAGRRVEASVSTPGADHEKPVHLGATRPVRPVGEQRTPAHRRGSLTTSHFSWR